MMTPGDSPCLAESDLMPLATGDPMPPEARARLESHLRGCPLCRESLKKLKDSIQELRQLPMLSTTSVNFPDLTADSSYPPQPPSALDRGASEFPAAIGKYRIVGRLGSGGQADVFRALHPTLPKDLVIKLSRREAEDDPAVRESLLVEGRVLSELEHPNLARVYDMDFHENRPFLVLEYVRGRNLGQVAGSEPFSHRRAAALVAALARALGAAHRRGVIHKDMKPENILIDEEGRPRIIDFGLARMRDAWVHDPEEPGTISGTLHYMAPEQAQGESDRIGSRSDIFALGGVLYFLLAGKAPFEGKDGQDCLRRARQCDFDRSALRARGVPGRLERICLKAMEARPEDRHARAEDLASELEAFLQLRRILVRGAALAVLAALAASALLWLLPWITRHGLLQVTGTFAAPTLEVQVWRGEEMGRLADLVPLRTGDDLKIRFEVPAGLKASLFWFDTEGKIHELSLAEVASSPTHTVLAYPVAGKSVMLAGPPGTEVIFACARSSEPPQIKEIGASLLSGGAWPELPPRDVLVFDRLGVRLQGSRGPGAVKDIPEGALRRAESLQQELSRRFEWVQGLGFPHGN